MRNDRRAMSGPWRGLLDGAERARAMRVVAEIAGRLRTLGPGELDPSLADGAAGIALMYRYFARITGEDDTAADDFLTMAIEKASADPGSAGIGLYAGLCGVGWVGAHFDRLSDIRPESGGDLDELLVTLLEEGPWHGPWELMYGLAGIGAYLLESGNAVGEALVVEQLAEVPGDDGEWVTHAERLFGPDRVGGQPDLYVDLGMAHGVPGALALCASARFGDSEPARRLATSAARCVLAHELPLEEPRSRYPSIVGLGEDRPEPARLAWCYGDAGVAAALAAASAVLPDPDLAAAAARAATAAAERPYDTSGVVDLGLCHGVAGVAQALGRLACADETLVPAARSWARRLVDQAEAGGLPEEPGFLTGQAGVALALLAACNDLDPSWDRVMLLPSSDDGPSGG